VRLPRLYRIGAASRVPCRLEIVGALALGALGGGGLEGGRCFGSLDAGEPVDDLEHDGGALGPQRAKLLGDAYLCVIRADVFEACVLEGGRCYHHHHHHYKYRQRQSLGRSNDNNHGLFDELFSKEKSNIHTRAHAHTPCGTSALW